MTALIIGLLGKVWPILVGALGALGWGFAQRRAGARAERARQAEAEAKARDVADEVSDDIGALTPEQQRERLRQLSKGARP